MLTENTPSQRAGRGPLSGLRAVELAGIGPGPFCGMSLADLGVEVIRVERANAADTTPPGTDVLLRNRCSIALDLKKPAALQALLRLVDRSDLFFEGFRPGVAERLGCGPEICLQRNPRLVYGRITGWGQTGPLAPSAGHDINYLGLSGALHLIGPPSGKPVPPLNLVADFGGGGMLLAFGMLAAYVEAQRSGRGQVVDAAMVDGAVALLGMSFAHRAAGTFVDATGENFLGGAAPWYDTYVTRDAQYMAVGALEPQFFTLMLQKLGLDPKEWRHCGFPATDEHARRDWPQLRAAIGRAIASRTRDEWRAIFEGSDACVTPVLSLAEAAQHPHNQQRGTFLDVAGIEQNAPAPRFSRTPAGPVRPPRPIGSDTRRVLRECGMSDSEIDQLI
jgi:alpha-methylacyl-CoA racemase